MGRVCSDCGDFLPRSSFSSSQLRKPDNRSRCKDCVSGCGGSSRGYGGGGYNDTYQYSYECADCGRTFNNENNLNMHAQVHRPRNVACPICGEVRFRSGANAVQHVESGYFSGCRGAENARSQIYQFASQQTAMGRYMTGTPMLEYGGGGGYGGGVPDYPYHCPECSKSFCQLSQLLQHQDQKHNVTRMLAYY